MSSQAKKLGMFSVVLLGINGIIGAGIFGLPNKVYALVGNWSLGVVTIDAVLAILLVLCFAEVSAWFSDNGGPYLYAKAAFGNFIGYEVGMTTLISIAINWAVEAVFFSDQLAVVMPSANTYWIRTAVAVGVILLLSAVNLAGVKAGKMVNNVVTVAKLLPIAMLIIVGLVMYKISYSAASANQNLPLLSPALTPTHMVNALLLFFYAFSGFERLVLAAGDMKNASRNLPIALLITIVSVSLIYLIVLGVCIHILGPTLGTSSSPLAFAARELMGPTGYAIVETGIVISVLGINFSFSYVSPRTAVALADTGVLPKTFFKTNKLGAPVSSIIIVFILSAGSAFIGHFAYLASITVAVRLLVLYLPTVLSTPVLRIKYKGMAKPGQFRLPGGMIIPIIAAIPTLFVIGYEAKSSWSLFVVSFGILIVLAPFYLIVRKNMASLGKSGLAHNSPEGLEAPTI